MDGLTAERERRYLRPPVPPRPTRNRALQNKKTCREWTRTRGLLAGPRAPYLFTLAPDSGRTLTAARASHSLMIYERTVLKRQPSSAMPPPLLWTMNVQLSKLKLRMIQLIQKKRRLLLNSLLEMPLLKTKWTKLLQMQTIVWMSDWSSECDSKHIGLYWLVVSCTASSLIGQPIAFYPYLTYYYHWCLIVISYRDCRMLWFRISPQCVGCTFANNFIYIVNLFST